MHEETYPWNIIFKCRLSKTKVFPRILPHKEKADALFAPSVFILVYLFIYLFLSDNFLLLLLLFFFEFTCLYFSLTENFAFDFPFSESYFLIKKLLNSDLIKFDTNSRLTFTLDKNL